MAALLVPTSVGLNTNLAVNGLVAKSLHLYSRSAPETLYRKKTGLPTTTFKIAYYKFLGSDSLFELGGLRVEFYSLSNVAILLPPSRRMLT